MDDIEAEPIGEQADVLVNCAGMVVDGSCAKPFHDIFLARRDSRKYFSFEGPRNLNRDVAYTSRSSMNQDLLGGVNLRAVDKTLPRP